MIERIIKPYKRHKDKGKTRARRRLINAIVDDEPIYPNVSLPNRFVYDEGGNSLSPYRRYISSQIGRDINDIYSDLSHMRIYKGPKYIKRMFLDDVQRCDDYYRDTGNRLQRVTDSITPTIYLEGEDTHVDMGRSIAKVIVWFPYNTGRYVVIGGTSPHLEPTTAYWYRRGWYGLYVETKTIYSHSLILDDKGRPVFTKREYEIHDVRTGNKRTIPIGGPLLKETSQVITIKQWDSVGYWELHSIHKKHNH